MQEGKKGYITMTYRLRFYDKHLDWLCQTKILYNKVIRHYYDLLFEHQDLLSFSNYDLMRELEIMTVGTREMKKIGKMLQNLLADFPTVPLYFRRAAINCAIGMVRSFQTQKRIADLKLQEPCMIPSKSEAFSADPVYYKGMYKEMTEESILLKVFTGKKWIWNRYRFCRRSLPNNAVILSPTIYIEKGQAYLHVPIRKVVENIQTVKERMQTEKRILAVSFRGMIVLLLDQ